MTQEEKAKRYDDLLVKLQEAKVDNNVCDERYCCVIDNIVPELKEFEGESIRKRLIELLKNNDEQHYAKEIAWLEEKGEQKPTMIQWKGNNLKEVERDWNKNYCAAVRAGVAQEDNGVINLDLLL